MDMPISHHAYTRLPPIFTKQTSRPHKCKQCKKHCFCKMRTLAHLAPEAVGTPYPCALVIFGFGKDLSMLAWHFSFGKDLSMLAWHFSFGKDVSMFARHFRLVVFERASLVYDGGVMHTPYTR